MTIIVYKIDYLSKSAFSPLSKIIVYQTSVKYEINKNQSLPHLHL